MMRMTVPMPMYMATVLPGRVAAKPPSRAVRGWAV